ncbi:class I SAM-dependent methyltransferase [Endozoicomonas sp. ONNA1]|uniref:class I SAM-dependent methyltransferase n=1 Tax=Endozoicomonas sp. ONNA1 TaxID=2828740 RepID=UPI002148A1A5|nr:class I SAM-dependent methyltransferase [Endozoicomonas sp. ONNA1]
MNRDRTKLLSEVADYYSAKLAEHGETAGGVDWNGEESQALRFEQLCKIIDVTENFSINDLGCGFGSLYDYLEARYKMFSYSGIDVSKDMVETANNRYADKENACFVVSNEPESISDYSVASGIFNVRMERSDDQWRKYFEETLAVLDRNSRLGFSFNCLTSYSDEDKMHDYLYYANPCELFDLCKRRYSLNVGLLHDYGLYEFTILVRKKL